MKKEKCNNMGKVEIAKLIVSHHNFSFLTFHFSLFFSTQCRNKSPRCS
jgi:hypothetical protein